METLQVVLVSITGFTSCLAMLRLASTTRTCWWRVSLTLLAALGLVFQGAIWTYVTLMLKALHVGGSFLWLYAALATSIGGTIWALALLLGTIRCRRSAS